MIRESGGTVYLTLIASAYYEVPVSWGASSEMHAVHLALLSRCPGYAEYLSAYQELQNSLGKSQNSINYIKILEMGFQLHRGN